MLNLKFLKKPDLGLFIIRAGLGIMMMIHGVPKLIGGEATLTGLGGAMSVYGITAFPLFWGIMGALTESLGGLLLAIGYKARLASLFLTFMMLTACLSQYQSTGSFYKYAWSLELMIVFLGLSFLGAGKFAIEKD